MWGCHDSSLSWIPETTRGCQVKQLQKQAIIRNVEGFISWEAKWIPVVSYQKMERKVLAVGKSLFRPHHLFAGWWFQTFFIFHNIWALYGNNHPNWLIFFRGVETTNQSSFVWGFMLHGVLRFVTWHTQLTGHRGAFCRARLYQQKLGSSRGGSNAGGEEFWVTEKQLNESYDHLPKINISYLYVYIYIFIIWYIYIYNYFNYI